MSPRLLPVTVGQRHTPAQPPEAFTPTKEDPAAAARATGYTEGWSHGSQAAQAVVRARGEQAIALAQAQHEADRQVMQRLAATLRSAADQVQATTIPEIEAILDAVLDTALELAEMVLGHEPVAATEPGKDALRRALTALGTDEPVAVRLHPADATEVKARLDEVPFTVVADPTLRRGDAIAVHRHGQVEVLLQQALVRARRELLP